MKKFNSIVALALAGTMLLAGCGSTEPASEAQSSEAQVEAEENVVQEEEESQAEEETSEEEAVDDETEAVEETTEDNEEAVEEVTETEVVEETIFSHEELAAMSSVDFAAQLKMGWNLGNTLDATGSSDLSSETSWQQPKATQELVSYVKSVGFTSIRIPVSWGKHTDENYQIDPEWMARVKEVVDYAYNENMYVIINSHHDNDYYYPSEENYDNAEKYLTTIWTQIAEEFKDYDDHLIFESMNEPRLAGTGIEWYFNVGDATGKAAIERICKLNQAFVNVIRNSGGNNPDRFIMVPSYAANPDFALNSSFSMPEDPSNKVMLSVHAYTPYDFAGNANGYSKWTSEKNYEFGFMGKLDAMFVCKGYGVVIGEFGATNKGNDEDRYLWAKGYCSKAASIGIPYFIWDNGGTGVGEENFGVINRTTLELSFPEVFEGYKSGYNH